MTYGNAYNYSRIERDFGAIDVFFSVNDPVVMASLAPNGLTVARPNILITGKPSSAIMNTVFVRTYNCHFD